jgi:glutamate-1-semialdehyde 2,1-aminomutase
MLVNDTSTTSKRSLWPEKTRNLWVMGANRSKLQLSNGQWYDDWASALGANTLGYDWDADRTIFRPAASLPWDIERDFADEFCAAMGTKAVRFFKSGSDAVSCAVRLARAYTKRSHIIVFDQSYHGTANEFKPIAWHQAGYVDTPAIRHPFGRRLIKGSLDMIAAIVVEPVPKAIELPPAGWLQHLREVCDEYGILLISDEIILGYRHALAGYLSAAGVRADLVCYGKAMGQGAAISACTGWMDVMSQLADTVHFSGTNNGEPSQLSIAQATLRRYLADDTCKRLKLLGQSLRILLHAASFETKGLDTRFEVVSTKAATEFCFDRGVLFPGFCSMATTHTIDQMGKLVETLVDWRKTNA